MGRPDSTTVIKGIVQGYFYGALALSASHTVTSFVKLGLTDGEQWFGPLAIDGLAVLGLALRGKKWDDGTNRFGLGLQVAMSVFQLAGNVYANTSIGGMLLGVLVVAGYLIAETAKGRMRTRASADAEAAVQEAERIAERAAQELADKKAAAIAKGLATKAAKKAQRAADAKVLERLAAG